MLPGVTPAGRVCRWCAVKANPRPCGRCGTVGTIYGRCADGARVCGRCYRAIRHADARAAAAAAPASPAGGADRSPGCANPALRARCTRAPAAARSDRATRTSTGSRSASSATPRRRAVAEPAARIGGLPSGPLTTSPISAATVTADGLDSAVCATAPSKALAACGAPTLSAPTADPVHGAPA